MGPINGFRTTFSYSHIEPNAAAAMFTGIAAKRSVVIDQCGRNRTAK
jgi:hypothetical protein